MTLKKLSLLLSLFSFTICHSALAKDPLVVSGNTNAPPISWEEHKALTGAGPDLVSSILDELKVNYEVKVTGNWGQVQKKAKEGKIDLIVGAVKNDERAQFLDFSIPYVVQPAVVVTEAGKEFKFNTLEDLVGKRGVSNIGESYGQKFDEFAKNKLDIKYVALERAIELMNLGEADYLVIDLYTALIYARYLRGEDAITILEKPVSQEKFHIAIAKGSPYSDLLPEIDKKLQKALDDHFVSHLFYKHFDSWKELSAKRSAYLNHDAGVRAEENEEFHKNRDMEEKARLGELMGYRDEYLPESVR